MPHTAAPLQANVTKAGLSLDEAALARALANLPAGAPVVVMTHGYRYAPGAKGNCPHGHILSLEPPTGNRNVISWPRHLGLAGDKGLAIAFGWQARGSLRAASLRANPAGSALAQLAAIVQRLDPGRPVDVIAHSLGARVAMRALAQAEAHGFRRIILLAGAEMRGPAQAAMASPAGRCAHVFNVTTRENDLFDFLFEWLAGAGWDSAIGQGLRHTPANWLDMQIDQPATLAALAQLGYPLAAPPHRICHWSPYVRPGIFGIYRALLDGSLNQATLRDALPITPDRRWSRLFARPWSRLRLRAEVQAVAP